MKPISDIYSTLSGVLVGRHPALGVLVSADGHVKMAMGWNSGCSLRADHKYRSVRINGKWKFIHRLMAETFIVNPENKPTVDHIDRDTINNVLANLRWATHSEQRENSSQVLEAMDLGIRCKDNPKEYARRNANRMYQIKSQDPQWVLAERERHKEYVRVKSQDPEWRKKQAEKQREYRKRKKARQLA